MSPAVGTKVRVTGWLGGCVMTVQRHVRDGFCELAFENGNTAPGFYHADLLVAA